MLVVGANAKPFLLPASATIFLVSSDQPVSHTTAKKVNHITKTTTTTKQLHNRKQQQKHKRDDDSALMRRQYKGSDQQQFLQSLPSGTDGIIIKGGISVQRLLPDVIPPSPRPLSKQVILIFIPLTLNLLCPNRYYPYITTIHPVDLHE